jgi:hypothetical protein
LEAERETGGTSERSAWTRFWTGEMFSDEATSKPATNRPTTEPEPPNAPRGVQELRGGDRSLTLQPQAHISLIGFALGYCTWAISQVLAWNQIGTLQDLSSGFARNYQRRANSVIEALGLAGWAEIIAGLLMAGAVIYFFYQAYSNLERFGVRDLRFPRNQTVWTWFVPILNLFRPKQIANDIWRASTAFDPKAPGAWREAPVTFAMLAWWILWLIGQIVGTRLALTSLENIEVFNPQFELAFIYAGIGIFAVHTIAAVLLIDFMIKIRDKQTRLAELQFDGQGHRDAIGDPGTGGTQRGNSVPAKASHPRSPLNETLKSSEQAPPAPAGWYDASGEASGRRFWDGSSWRTPAELECELCGASLTGPYCGQCGAKEKAVVRGAP